MICKSSRLFGNPDGILVINAIAIHAYVSGVGSYLFRRIGYSAELAGLPVTQQAPTRASLAERALRERKCFTWMNGTRGANLGTGGCTVGGSLAGARQTGF